MNYLKRIEPVVVPTCSVCGKTAAYVELKAHGLPDPVAAFCVRHAGERLAEMDAPLCVCGLEQHTGGNLSVPSLGVESHAYAVSS